MRLIEIRNILNRERVNLIPKIERLGENILIESTVELFSSLDEIKKANVFVKTCDGLKEFIVSNTLQEETKEQGVLVFKENEGKAFVSKLRNFHKMVDGFIVGVSYFERNQSPESINIKLPKIFDPETLGNAISDIAKNLKQISFCFRDGGQIKVKSVSKGSLWIEIFTNAKTAALIGATMLWLLKIRSDLLGIEETKMKIRSLELDEKIKNETLKALEKKRKEEDLNLLREICNDAGIEIKNHEQLCRLKVYAERLIPYLEKGAEIEGPITDKGRTLFVPESENLTNHFKLLKKKFKNLPQ